MTTDTSLVLKLTHILITGANGALGSAIARNLSMLPNIHLILSARTIEKAEAINKKIINENPKARTSVIELDITSAYSVDTATSILSDPNGISQGRLDVLINNAGVSNQHMDLATAVIENVKTNTAGSVRITEAITPCLLNSTSPRLVFIGTSLASLASRADIDSPLNGVDVDAYRASKAALNMIMLGYHRRLKSKGIIIHSVCPGFLATNFAAPADDCRKMGAIEAEEGAKIVVDTVMGKRDVDAGKVIAADGAVYDW